MKLIFRPLKTGWIDKETPDRQYPRFKASWTDTLKLLDREIDLLANGGKFHAEVILEVDAPESAMRLDGGLRADAKVNHPGVVISFESKHGPLRYACDRFTGTYKAPAWQQNVRAIALGLEALRKVERYGIAQSGQQYTGWKELGSGVPMPAAKMDRRTAATVLLKAMGTIVSDSQIERVLTNPDERKKRYRMAVQATHPDSGGSNGAFQELQEAMNVLNGESK